MRKMFAIAIVVAVFLVPCRLVPAGAMETPLRHGSVRTCPFEDLTLHVYATGDAMADQCFALETPDRLIAIESPAFDLHLREWQAYLDGLDKPLTDILLAFHPTGGAWYGDAVSHATDGARKAIAEGGTGALITVLKRTFGDGFNDEVSSIDSILGAGANRIGGVEFLIAEDGDGDTIAIPAIGAVYMHMLGARVHSILTGPEHIDAFIGALEGFRDGGYTLFLSGHHTPETAADVDEKIAYLREVSALAEGSVDRADFLARMRAAFPSYAGENYLDMTASALFAE